MRINKFKNICENIFSECLSTIFFIFVLAVTQIIMAQEKPLNLSQIETALRSPKSTPENRNKLLSEGVEQRKITFWLTPENDKKIRSWGGNNALIETIRKNSPPTFPMIKRESKNSLEVKNSIGMELVLIPKGEFMMGAIENEPGSNFNEKPQHKVKINQEFYLGKFEVTQKQWKTVMKTNPGEFSKCGDDCPVESVSWTDAQEFIKKLNAKNDGYKYRLPSEAEWEYAARAMTKTRFYWGNDETEKDWQFYAHSNDQSIVKVGSYLPNAFGLYDMSGNVWEFTEDVWHTDYAKSNGESSANLKGDTTARVMKGGSLSQFHEELRPARRGRVSINTKMNSVGFRIVADVAKS
jgi:formylglycine-generating enzyme required for sulfatase activity